MPDDPVDASIPLDQRDPASLTRGERAILARRSVGVGGASKRALEHAAALRSGMSRKAFRRAAADQALVREAAILYNPESDPSDVSAAAKVVLQANGDLRPDAVVVDTRVAFRGFAPPKDAAKDADVIVKTSIPTLPEGETKAT
jgi:hypothetical protein